MTSTPRHLLSRSLSRCSVVLAELLFTGGVSIGWLVYLHRASTQARHVPGANAWWQHAAVAVVALGIVAALLLRHRSWQDALHLLLAPLSRLAAHRVRVLYRQMLRRPASFGRALIASPLLLLLLYGFFRAGYQVTSGLDPNHTINAWGGPTYFGAMACHYLDTFVIMAISALLLHVVLPRSGRARTSELAETGRPGRALHGSGV